MLRPGSITVACMHDQTGNQILKLQTSYSLAGQHCSCDALHHLRMVKTVSFTLPVRLVYAGESAVP